MHFCPMFERLQTKWKVNSVQLFLVLSVFAIAGSATGYLGKLFMNWFSIDRGWLWTVVYIIIITLIWPLMVIIVSIPFGQLPFFTRYLQRMGTRMKILKKSEAGNRELEIKRKKTAAKNSKGNIQNAELKTQNMAIFASGTGTNAKRIMDYFAQHPAQRGKENENQAPIVKLVVCNKPGAGVLHFAEEAGVETLIIEKEKFFRGNGYVEELKAAGIDFIVLAGFLWKIPQQLIDAYRNRIVNIHPALLPKYGGKGMYGSRVHEAVIENREKESGITIHYVDEHYDNGDIIYQVKVEIAPNETAESLAQKIHHLEHSNYPRIIEQLLLAPNGS
jgi:phosphoribosylglycinamide formyltransferase 1